MLLTVTHKQKQDVGATFFFLPREVLPLLRSLYKNSTKTDVHEAAVILELSHICRHCHSHDMSVVGVAP